MKITHWFLIVTISHLLFFTACRSSDSQKGAWTEQDKQLLKDKFAEAAYKIDTLGEKKQEFIDCYFEKLEQNYKSFAQANSDFEGCVHYCKECYQQISEN